MTPTATQFCAKCGARKSAGARFCESCGAATSPAGLQPSSRARELFEQSMTVEEAKRQAWIEEACAGDSALLAEVNELMQATQMAPVVPPTVTAPPIPAPANSGAGVLSTFGSSTPSTHPTLQSPGAEYIGVYRLVRELGRGGMGVVYLAVRDDGAFRKNVALKLLLRDQVSPEFILRFKQERQVVAALDHPNIARILDGGDAPGGMPYYVMEYVEGKQIDKYCDEQQLSMTGRIKLFQQVCHAVHYLHQNSIVHRDLKPANILISSDGVVKLLDFGIAKVVGAASMANQDLTSVTGRPMTPIYASPEQMAGANLQKTSDIYSLGVILYKLLTGRAPYESLDDKVAKLAAREEPPAPSANIREDLRAKPESTAQLRRAMLGGLDSIVLMAMRYDPKKRYQSAADLADDLERFLEGQSVIAHHETMAIRSMKLIRRKRAAVAVLAAFLTVSGFGAWQWRRVQTERAEATAREAKLKGLLDNLEGRLNSGGEGSNRRSAALTSPSAGLNTQPAVKAATEQVVTEKINDVRSLKKELEAGFATAVARSGHSPELDTLLDRGIRYLDKLRASSPDSMELKAEVGNTYAQLGELEETVPDANAANRRAALQTYEKAVELLQVVFDGRPDDWKARERLTVLSRRIRAMGGDPGATASAVSAVTPVAPAAATGSTPAPVVSASKSPQSTVASRPQQPLTSNTAAPAPTPVPPQATVASPAPRSAPVVSAELEERLINVTSKVQIAEQTIEPIQQSLAREGQTLNADTQSALYRMRATLEKANREIAAGNEAAAGESLTSAEGLAARILRSVGR
jgi:serine/threonine protein kinase